MLKILRYEALNSGPHLVVLGAVHGNETCGTIAIEQLISSLDQGDLMLEAGTVTCIPVCNPEAYRRNIRFYERNLNRSLYVKDTPKLYEDFIDPILCRILNQADALLDLHSYASQGEAFGFLGTSSPQEIKYCLSLGVKDFVYGWSEAFGKSSKETGVDPRESMGTTEYARSKGCLSTTIECGHHQNKNAPEIGYTCILSALAHFGIIKIDLPQEIQENRFVKMKTVFFRESEGRLSQPWKHYDKVKSGDLLAEYVNGKQLLAPQDGFIILPKLQAEIGGEWFYFGEETSCPTV